MKNLKWTKSYCGVSHLGELDHNNVRVTVTEYKSFSELRRFPRNFEKTIVTAHDTVAAAKQAGEKWMEQNYSPSA